MRAHPFAQLSLHPSSAAAAVIAVSPTAPSGINADGLIGILLWVVGIIAAYIGIKIIARADSSAPRRNAETGVNLIIGMTVIVIFLGGAAVWSAFEGVRDLVLRGGQNTTQQGGVR